jgi:hypothetical protein
MNDTNNGSAAAPDPHVEAYFALKEAHAVFTALSKLWDDHGNFEDPNQAFHLVEIARKRSGDVLAGIEGKKS